jgi:hypothetical protein
MLVRASKLPAICSVFSYSPFHSPPSRLAVVTTATTATTATTSTTTTTIQMPNTRLA